MRHEDSMTGFSRALRFWTRSPTERSAREARARVLGALETRRAAAPWRYRLTMAVAVLMVAIALLFSFPASEPAVKESVEAPEAERFLVVTLASGNRLYIQLSPPSPRNPQS